MPSPREDQGAAGDRTDVWYRVLLTVLGTGYSPVAPGTCGSAVVAVLFLVLAALGVHPLAIGAVLVVLMVEGSWVTLAYGDRLIAVYGPDPHAIVSDEQVGQALALLGYVWIGPHLTTLGELAVFTGAAFVLFRFFDVTKVPPAAQAEKIPGAAGVLLDDVVAGAYALIVLQLGYWAWRWWQQSGGVA